MNLGDKIMTLRRKQGWSQEELARLCQVSRQSVSKWESGQSAPDLDKILVLSRIFGISTDFLLKEEYEREQILPKEEASAPEAALEDAVSKEAEEGTPRESVVARRRVGREEASDFLEHEAGWASRMGFGVMMCVLSPVLLIELSGLGSCGVIPLNDNQGSLIGLICLFLILIWPVMTFIRYGIAEREYTYISEGRFAMAYGVDVQIQQQRKAYQPVFTRNITFGVTLCLISVIPILIGAFWEKEVFEILAVGFLLIVVSFAVYLFVSAAITWGSYDRLLKEGDYNPKTGDNSLAGKIGAIFWPLMAAIYLAWSFLSRDWHITWLVWPVAGCVFAAISAACRMAEKE